jgi:hypothetical protein
VVGKIARRRIRRWGRVPESPYLSGACDVGQVMKDGFEFELGVSIIHCIYWSAAAHLLEQ